MGAAARPLNRYPNGFENGQSPGMQHRATSQDPITSGQAKTGALWDAATPLQLPLQGERLDLATTLSCGQAFRWWPLDPEQARDAEPSPPVGQVWEGIAADRVWRLWLASDALVARVAPALEPASAIRWLIRYFALDQSIERIQTDLAARHPAVRAAVKRYPGLRILRQESHEAFLSFTIASATNVPRIQRCLETVARRHGRLIAQGADRAYYAFPTADAILAAPVDDLAGPCNLAYRAHHLRSAATALATNGPSWLSDLAAASYPEAHAALDALPAIGPKIADCICLFGLGFDQAVPIDTHVWAIAHELFGPQIPSRTLTPRTYRYLGDLLRDRFGPYAGWAQQYLFQVRRDQPTKERFRPRDAW